MRRKQLVSQDLCVRGEHIQHPAANVIFKEGETVSLAKVSVFWWNTCSTQLQGAGRRGKDTPLKAGRTCAARMAQVPGSIPGCIAPNMLPFRTVEPQPLTSSPVRVLLQPLKVSPRHFGPQRERRPRRRHQQRLPRRAVAAREARAQDADWPQREGQLTHVELLLGASRLPCRCSCPASRAAATVAAAALLGLLWSAILLTWQGGLGAALQLAQPQLQLPHLALHMGRAGTGAEAGQWLESPTTGAQLWGMQLLNTMCTATDSAPDECTHMATPHTLASNSTISS